MKRMTTLLTVMLGLCLTACSQSAKNKENQDMKKTLVTYFSATGTTKAAAERLAEEVNGDLFEIQPEAPYTAADLDWRDSTSRSTLEMKDLSSRPAIKDVALDLTQYDTVYVGFPIWWYTAPTIINTFIEAHDFAGKTVIPFATSGGSTIDKACADLKATYPDIKWGEGRLMND